MVSYKAALLMGLVRLCHAIDDAIIEKIGRGVGTALNYAVFSKKVAYSSPEDFDPEGETFASFTLAPGDSIKYYCGRPCDRRSGRIKMYPEDPRRQTLAPMVNSGFKDSIKRVLNNFDVFRSDRTLIYYSCDFLGGGYLIQYPRDAIIVSKNLDFSLNFACVFEDVYRWVEIKFKNVMPMPYGCGSGDAELFDNLLPLGGLSSMHHIRYSPVCEIVPEPGMIIGIYCATGETFDGKECFEQRTDEDGDEPLLYDPEFKFTGLASKLHLFKVPKEGFPKDVSFRCKCFNPADQLTSLLKIVSSRESVCDFKASLDEAGGELNKIVAVPCRKELHPGDSLRIITPLDDSVVKYSDLYFTSKFAPGTDTVFAQDLQENVVKAVPLTDVVASTGLSVEVVVAPGDRGYKLEDYDWVAKKRRVAPQEHVIRYKKDSILVLKTEHANLTYEWQLHLAGVMSRDRESIVRRTISVGLIPTDPYTFGCGARDNHIFREDRVDFRIEHWNKFDAKNGRVECTIDAEKMSPVGFYCPRGAVLEPAGCFENVFDENGNVVELNDVTSGARVFRGQHIVGFEVLRTEGSDGKQRMVECKCSDVDGRVLATIKVVVRASYASRFK
ncbi:hypothetical protein BEWA_024360 [Theileria equi strain WA]|uniref:6-Cys domain-containing protein n=1 Tax=Theileria equi strain WA TaxID=1537102 RepID=L0AVF2_THEEQ|nr:hypothetical protein BEWA_024360 [Theileria equi strain WA]AFZ79587.1 hypothetical protein BEWA_024360 [Theileria equi strain WA]|eukprot:XP_004829253.1 hypothetical protein BEWA_024360 [Theileria equi strain WA]